MKTKQDALFIGTSPFLNVRNVQLSTLAAFHRLPATHSEREYAEAGGLMSYGSNIADAYHQAGAYTGRILKGARPADSDELQGMRDEFHRYRHWSSLRCWCYERIMWRAAAPDMGK
jgi:ABC-type uncharacterized transport system substrate-binding protein